MDAGMQSRADRGADGECADCPDVAVRESAPGTSVFVESGNTEGWIATDSTLEVTR